MAWTISADPQRFNEAVDWFAKRTVITRDQALQLDTRAKTQAFWVGGGLQLSQVQRVFDEINTSLEQGESFEEFRTRVRDQLRSPAHAEVVFRNATQRAYNAGRWHQMQDESVKRFRPFWMYDAILDGRTTVICRRCNQVILEADDPWWDEHWPPQHHNCRAGVRNLRRQEAERRGITSELPDADAADGFGASPRFEAGPIKPKPGRIDPVLRVEIDRKDLALPKRAKRPEAHNPDHWVDEYKTYGDAKEAVAWGRASLERGLDASVDDVKALLEPLSEVPGVRSMLDSLEGTAGARTLREQAGELVPLRKAAAAFAGHLQEVGQRPAVQHASLQRHDRGRRALALFSRATGSGVQHPESWSVRVTRGRAGTIPARESLTWSEHDGVLEHEWAHALEALNSNLARQAVAFLQARTADERTRRLSDLSPGKGYGPTEFAKKDGFLDAYIGKIYEVGGRVYGTEITSMALELLSAGRTNWGSLEGLLLTDPEHFLFLLGQLAGR